MLVRTNGTGTIIAIMDEREARLLAGLMGWISGGDNPNASYHLATDLYRELATALGLPDDAELPCPYRAHPTASDHPPHGLSFDP